MLPGGGPLNGAYSVGLALDLPEGWHTYWRYPGDAGLPPILSTEGSDNVASVSIGFPAPERYDDGFSTSIVYHDHVIFPLDVTPIDPSRPVDLRLTVDYGYCREICVPARAELDATLDPEAPASPVAAAALGMATDRLPEPEALADPGAPQLVAVERQVEGAGPGSLLITVKPGAAGGPVDVFAEGPEGWYLGVPEPAGSTADGASTFRLSLKGAPKNADPAGATIRYTLVGAGEAVEAVRVLD